MRSSSTSSAPVHRSFSTSPTTPSPTRPIDYVRRVLEKQSPTEESTNSRVTPKFTTQSTPGTPTVHPAYRGYSSPVCSTKSPGRRAVWTPDQKHVYVASLDARAEEFVPGRGAAAAAAAIDSSADFSLMGDVDLNAYMRADAGAGDGTARSSPSVAVRESRSPSPASSVDEVKAAEADREEAERQWHLQAEPEDAVHEWGTPRPTAAPKSEVVRRVDEWLEGKAPSVGASLEEQSRPCLEQPPLSVSLPSTPSVATLRNTTTQPAPPGFAGSLDRARMIKDTDHVLYPRNIVPPVAWLGPSSKRRNQWYVV